MSNFNARHQHRDNQTALTLIPMHAQYLRHLGSSRLHARHADRLQHGGRLTKNLCLLQTHLPACAVPPRTRFHPVVTDSRALLDSFSTMVCEL